MIAVTGANGFIGSHLLKSLGSPGVELVGLTRQRTDQIGMRFLPDYSERALSVALEGVSDLVHAASLVHQPRLAAADYHRFNVEGTRRLMNAARAAGVRHVVFLSTIKVYGERPLDHATEDTPPDPQDPYAKTKLEAERIVLDAAVGREPVGTVLRLAPVYGPGEKGNVRRVINAVARRRFVLPGDGSTRKSLVHISTVITAVRAVLSKRQYGLFVVADPVAPSMRELADTAAVVLGLRKPIAVPAPILNALALPIEAVFGLLGRHPPVTRDLIRKSKLSTICSPRKAERMLGISCHVDLAAAVADEVAWMRASGLL